MIFNFFCKKKIFSFFHGTDGRLIDYIQTEEDREIENKKIDRHKKDKKRWTDRKGRNSLNRQMEGRDGNENKSLLLPV